MAMTTIGNKHGQPERGRNSPPGRAPAAPGQRASRLAAGVAALLLLLAGTAPAATATVPAAGRNPQTVRLTAGDPGAFTPIRAECAAGKNGAEPVLEVRGTFPGTFGVSRRLPAAGLRAARVEARVLAPANAPSDLQVVLFMKDKDGLWFQCPAEKAPARGAWETLVFDLTREAGRVQPQGHEAVWNDYYARHVAEVGLSWFSSANWAGTMTFGQLECIPPAIPEPLRIYGTEWLTPAPMKAYQQQELGFEIAGLAGLNPFDPDDVAVDVRIIAPDGAQILRPAFFYQGYRRSQDPEGREILTPAGRGGWRMRFTPTVAGTYRWRLTVQAEGGRKLETPDHEIRVEPAAARGFVQVSPKDGRFFETADGKFFYPVGEHIHTPYDARSVWALGLPLATDRGTFAYDYYYDKMQSCGMNSNLLWMSSWWLAIEWNAQWQGYFGRNDYHLGNAWRLDYLMDEAEKHGVHIVLVVDNHGKMGYADSEWSNNPLNRRLGGPCNRADEFFTGREAFSDYRKRMRYLVARWGEHPHLMGWELVSELDLVGAGGYFRWHQDTADWYARAASLLDELDRFKRPVTVQYCRDWHNLDPKVAQLPGVDFLLINAYYEWKRGMPPLLPLLQTTCRVAEWYKKPFYIAEYGGDSAENQHEQLFADFHNGMWECAMMPYAGGPFFWWYDFADRFNLYPQVLAFTRFMDGVDLRGVKWTYGECPVRKDEKGTDTVRALVMHGPDRGQAWIFDRRATESLEDARGELHQGVSVLVEGMQDGVYDVEFWDTFKGVVVERRQPAAANGVLKLEAPAFKVDCAVKYRLRTGGTPTPPAAGR